MKRYLFAVRRGIASKTPQLKCIMSELAALNDAPTKITYHVTMQCVYFGNRIENLLILKHEQKNPFKIQKECVKHVGSFFKDLDLVTSKFSYILNDGRKMTSIEIALF